jgi:hypothetical protein
MAALLSSPFITGSSFFAFAVVMISRERKGLTSDEQ